jgi:hypothetical protein
MTRKDTLDLVESIRKAGIPLSDWEQKFLNSLEWQIKVKNRFSWKQERILTKLFYKAYRIPALNDTDPLRMAWRSKYCGRGARKRIIWKKKKKI